MIAFSRISKQYGRQVLFVDASFQLNPGEKVGLVGPNGAGKTTLFRMIVGEETADEGDVSVPKKLTIGYFRQDVEEMSGRSVLDEAIAGSGRVGACCTTSSRRLNQAMADPGAGRRHGSHPGALRGGAGGIRASRRLRAREPGARSSARPGVRRRADRRRRWRALGRLEDARGDGPRPPRPARCPAPRRADEPSRHRIDHLARGVPQIAARRLAHDLARSGFHEPDRQPHRRDRRRRDHGLLRQLRFLRARTRYPRSQSRSRVRAPAGDAGQGTALHRALRGARRQGGAGPEPRQGARQDRADRAAEEAARRRL